MSVAISGAAGPAYRYAHASYDSACVARACHIRTVIARLDRAIQYAETPVIDREAAAYWIPRFRGGQSVALGPQNKLPRSTGLPAFAKTTASSWHASHTLTVIARLDRAIQYARRL
jgi:hypothetical protein